MDYTNAMATDDQAAKDQAVTDLTGYIGDFRSFLAGANPNLIEDALASLLEPHVSTVAGFVEAQAAQDWIGACSTLVSFRKVKLFPSHSLNPEILLTFACAIIICRASFE